MLQPGDRLEILYMQDEFHPGRHCICNCCWRRQHAVNLPGSVRRAEKLETDCAWESLLQKKERQPLYLLARDLPIMFVGAIVFDVAFSGYITGLLGETPRVIIFIFVCWCLLAVVLYSCICLGAYVLDKVGTLLYLFLRHIPC